MGLLIDKQLKNDLSPVMENLFGKTIEELQTLCAAEGWPRFTARQISDWLYAKHICNIDDMTNLARTTRGRLSEIAAIGRAVPETCQTSSDGTKKYLFTIGGTDSAGLHSVETVFIPDGERATACVSCQRGCRMGCRFCVTGRQGFHGNLTAGDILSQLVSLPENERLTNVVFMGMGEPMDNYDAVLAATRIMTADGGFGWSPHRITVSSVGITPMVERFIEESDCHVAISLHNPFPQQRKEIMPVENRYPVEKLIERLRRYDWHGQRRLSFEYIMFDGFNDSKLHCDALTRLLKGLGCRINLIRFHTSPDMPFRPSPREKIERFCEQINRQGLRCTVRASRGEDIMAACGLLSGQQTGNTHI